MRRVLNPSMKCPNIKKAATGGTKKLYTTIAFGGSHS
jgi:hypothetical protein